MAVLPYADTLEVLSAFKVERNKRREDVDQVENTEKSRKTMEVWAKIHAPTLGTFFMACDLSKPENPVMLADGDWRPSFVGTEFTARDCQQTKEGFELVCLAAMAKRLGVQLGTSEGRLNQHDETE